MLEITVDLLSGRPNPRWELQGDAAERVLDEIAASPSALTPPGAGFAGLGMRGLVVYVTDEEAAARRSLPVVLRVAGGGAEDDAAALALAERLLATGPDVIEAQAHEDLIAQMAEAQRRAASRPGPEPEPESEPPPGPPAAPGPGDPPPPTPSTVPDGGCKVELGALNLPFWNSRYIWLYNNNCYAYGGNRRTNTFPQPGRAAGKPITSHTQAATIAAALADGAIRQTYCQAQAQAPRWLVALVTTPDFSNPWDYHWYRKHDSGVWGHKPGQTVAQIYDNSGKIITNPQTCDRGMYTEWCGYYYAPASMVIG